MKSDEEWLLARGFPVQVEQEGPEIFWTHLVGPDKHVVAPNYGRGLTRDHSIKRARKRYEVEQLGEVPDT